MVLPQGPSARLPLLATRAGVGRMFWLSDVFRFDQNWRRQILPVVRSEHDVTHHLFG